MIGQRRGYSAPLFQSRHENGIVDKVEQAATTGILPRTASSSLAFIFEIGRTLAAHAARDRIANDPHGYALTSLFSCLKR
jgi:hypothetical protein